MQLGDPQLHLGEVHVSKEAVDDLEGLNGASLCRPHFLQSEHGTYVTVLPVSTISWKR